MAAAPPKRQPNWGFAHRSFTVGHAWSACRLLRHQERCGRSVVELEAKIRRLREENAKLLEQREVLKNRWHPLRSAAQRYARVEQMSGQNYRVAWLGEALLVSRSGYYDWHNGRLAQGTVFDTRRVLWSLMHGRERTLSNFAVMMVRAPAIICVLGLI